jgi:hypothetical protein
VEEERALEITFWLGQHPEVTNWVAVDDLNMGKLEQRWDYQIENDWGLDNFVHTPLSREGIKQNGVRENVLQFLNA